MPRVSQLGVRSALVWLLVGASIGLTMALARAGFVGPAVYRLIAFHNEALIVGWFVQFALCVAFWMLPKHSPKLVPEPELRRGNPRVMGVGLGALDLGVAVFGAATWFALPSVAIGARALSLIGVVCCATQLLPRLKGFGR